jgi:hypothetical protein
MVRTKKVGLAEARRQMARRRFGLEGTDAGR